MPAPVAQARWNHVRPFGRPSQLRSYWGKFEQEIAEFPGTSGEGRRKSVIISVEDRRPDDPHHQSHGESVAVPPDSCDDFDCHCRCPAQTRPLATNPAAGAGATRRAVAGARTGAVVADPPAHARSLVRDHPAHWAREHRNAKHRQATRAPASQTARAPPLVVYSCSLAPTFPVTVPPTMAQIVIRHGESYVSGPADHVTGCFS